MLNDKASLKIHFKTRFFLFCLKIFFNFCTKTTVLLHTLQYICYKNRKKVKCVQWVAQMRPVFVSSFPGFSLSLSLSLFFFSNRPSPLAALTRLGSHIEVLISLPWLAAKIGEVACRLTVLRGWLKQFMRDAKIFTACCCGRKLCGKNGSNRAGSLWKSFTWAGLSTVILSS